VIEIRERKSQAVAEGEGAEEAAVADDDVEGSAASETVAEAPAEAEASEDSTAAGYDEAVENGVPFSAEETIRAEFSADPVALTEADPMTEDELVLQDAGRDLRPDVIIPAPDVTPLALADLEAAGTAEEFAASTEDAATETDSALASSSDETAAKDESLKDEKQ
jgi:hypothetical protein